MSDIILKAEGLRKTCEVLKGIDLEVREGEFVAVVGESGSGKSTLLYMLAGIDKPTAGRVELLGRDTSEISDEELAALRRREVSFVYQFDNLVPHLTAYENIVLPLMLDGKKPRDYRHLTAYENIVLPLMLDGKKPRDYRGSVEDVCAFLGIEKRMKAFPRHLSGGEQQRVALARALVTSPRLIFLDEPTGSLDKERGEQVIELLTRINSERGVALFMVTHSTAHSSAASRVITIEDGRIVADDPR